MTVGSRRHLRCGPMHCSWSNLRGAAPRGAAILPFEASDVLLTHRGRVAIWWAVQSLGLSAGDEILVPAYHCGSEVDPLVRSGLKIGAYDVENDLSISVAKVAAAVTKKTRAVYVIHYFGIGQDLTVLAPWCNERSLMLIEDCALALFTERGGRPVGRDGDAAVFSFRKTLPVPDGGALVRKKGRKLTEVSLEPPPSRLIRFELGRSFGCWARGRLPRWMARRIGRSAAARAAAVDVRGDRLLPLGDDDRFDSRTVLWAMSRPSLRICGGTDPADVKARRRANFARLSERLREVPRVRPLLSSLPDGACPVVFPIECDQRAALYRNLLECDIAAIPWWAGFHEAIGWDAFPVARRLKESVVALPVHQGLGREHMDYMAECVCAFAARRVTAAAGDVMAVGG